MTHILDLQAIDSARPEGDRLVSNYSWAACDNSTVSLVLCAIPNPE